MNFWREALCRKLYSPILVHICSPSSIICFHFQKWPFNKYLFQVLRLNSKQNRHKKSFSPGCVSQLEHHPKHQKVAGLIPSQNTYLHCRFNPQLGCVWEATHWRFSPHPSLSQINKHILGWGFKKLFKKLIFGWERQKINTHKILSLSEVSECNSSNKGGDKKC